MPFSKCNLTPERGSKNHLNTNPSLQVMQVCLKAHAPGERALPHGAIQPTTCCTDDTGSPEGYSAPNNCPHTYAAAICSEKNCLKKKLRPYYHFTDTFPNDCFYFCLQW